MMNRKRIIFAALLCAALAAGGAFASGSAHLNVSLPVGMSGHLMSKEEQTALDEVLRYSNVPGREDTMALIRGYADVMTKGADAGLAKTWAPQGTLEYKESVCADNWAKAGMPYDGDCRMTAFNLLDTLISVEKKTETSGSYLMFDIEAMENNPAYRKLLARRGEFISVFNEMDIQNVDESGLEHVFPRRFKENGVRVDSDKVFLISVVLHDPDFGRLFVGHAGVMIDLGDKVVFVEKLAFEQPYMISVCKTREDLKNLLLARTDYLGDRTQEKGPFIYENDQLLR